ncbi:MAG: hypothetical protein GY777_28345, partial [Candidatus Brocadiaceae bacterium]|nr:hypothetical protein [Candidatus Brocadiaceae bacterium]
GHKVTFFTREKYLPHFQEEGIKIQSVNSKEKTYIKDCEFISQIKSLDGIDFLFINFRAEQRDDAALLLKDLDCSRVQLVLCFPIWNRSKLGFEKNFHHSHYLFPGIVGIYRGREVHFKKGTTRVSPLHKTSREESLRLCSILSSAGLPTEYKPNLIKDIQSLMGIAFPLLAALSIKDYKLNVLGKDKELLSIAVKSQKECRNIIKAGGDSIGFLRNLMMIAPYYLFTYLFSLSPYFIRGFNREMFEVHFKKIHRQTIFLLKELSSFQFAQDVKRDNLHKLLSMCTY